MSDQPEQPKPLIPLEDEVTPEEEVEMLEEVDDPDLPLYTDQENLRHAAGLLSRSVPREEITADLVGRGVQAITANLMVDELIQSRARAKRSSAVRGLVIGGLLILLGIYGLFAPMLLNPVSARVLAVGAILYGAAQFAQGVILLRK